MSLTIKWKPGHCSAHLKTDKPKPMYWLCNKGRNWTSVYFVPFHRKCKCHNMYIHPFYPIITWLLVFVWRGVRCRRDDDDHNLQKQKTQTSWWLSQIKFHIETSAFTLTVFSRRFYPKQLTRSPFVRRKRNNSISLKVL